MFMDSKIMKNLEDLRESLKGFSNDFWYFPKQETREVVNFRLRQILGFKYVRLFQQVLGNSSICDLFEDMKIGPKNDPKIDPKIDAKNDFQNEIKNSFENEVKS